MLASVAEIMAAARTYGRYYEVVENGSTVVPALTPEQPAPARRPRPPWRWRRRR